MCMEVQKQLQNSKTSLGTCEDVEDVTWENEQDTCSKDSQVQDSQAQDSQVKSKKKIALIGPAIDRLAKHVRWGSRLSSSFYRTVGLNISLRTITTKTQTSSVDTDFVIWQLSPSLNPSLLKSLMRGASGLIVAVGKSEETSEKDVENGRGNTSNTQTDNGQAAKHFYADEKQHSESSDAAKETIFDIEQLDKSAKQLKLPIAFIHFFENAAEVELAIKESADKHNSLEATSKNLSLPQRDNNLARQGVNGFNSTMNGISLPSTTKNGITKLRETDHSLHLGLESAENSEYCLDQAFDYIADYFANAA